MKITTYAEYQLAEKELNAILPFQHLLTQFKRVIELSEALDIYVSGFEHNYINGIASIEGI